MVQPASFHYHVEQLRNAARCPTGLLRDWDNLSFVFPITAASITANADFFLDSFKRGTMIAAAQNYNHAHFNWFTVPLLSNWSTSVTSQRTILYATCGFLLSVVSPLLVLNFNPQTKIGTRDHFYVYSQSVFFLFFFVFPETTKPKTRMGLTANEAYLRVVNARGELK